MKDSILKLLHHMQWANTRVIETLRGQPHDSARLTLTHLISAERIWLTRLQQSANPPLPGDQGWSVDECERVASATFAALEALVAHLDEAALSQPFTYKSLKGLEFRNTIGDILLHVAMHGSYHRGQISLKLREGGQVPVATDYILYLRERDAKG